MTFHVPEMRETVCVAFYDEATGIFTGREYVGPARMLAANTPAGLVAWDTLAAPADPVSQRVDVATGVLVDYQPPMPDDRGGELSWAWDEIARRWVSTQTPAYYWRVVRTERNRRLSETDYMVLRAQEQGGAVPLAWRQYRQALRDITTQPDPTSITWPVRPPGE